MPGFYEDPLDTVTLERMPHGAVVVAECGEA